MAITRRGFIEAILATGVAPFVVRAESLMAVRVPVSGLIIPPEIYFLTLPTLLQFGAQYTIKNVGDSAIITIGESQIALHAGELWKSGGQDYCTATACSSIHF